MQTALWVGFVRKVGEQQWQMRATGRVRDEVWSKLRMYYPAESEWSYAILPQSYGRPYGPTTIPESCLVTWDGRTWQ